MKTRPQYSFHYEKNAPNYFSLNNSRLVDFSHNDYLGLRFHHEIKKSIQSAAEKHSFGSGGSARISGYNQLHQAVESAFSAWLNRSTLLVNSGLCANLGLYRCLFHKTDHIACDKYAHASTLDGIKLSGAILKRYSHQSMSHLAMLLEQHPIKAVSTETVFSMQGSITPIQTLLSLIKHYKTQLILDDAHGIGVYGKRGRHVLDQMDLSFPDNTIFIYPLGKAFHASGCIIASNTETIEKLRYQMRTYLYTTHCSPLLCAGLLSALDIIKTNSGERKILAQHINYFNHEAKARGLPLLNTEASAIRPIRILKPTQAFQMQEQLLQLGFFVPAILPPTTPPNSAIFRVVLNAKHTVSEIKKLIEAFSHTYSNENQTSYEKDKLI